MGEWQTLISVNQVAQSSTQQGDCEPVLMDEDRPVPEDQDESEENEDDDDEKDEEWCEEEVSSVQCSLSLYTLRDLLVYHHTDSGRGDNL